MDLSELNLKLNNCKKQRETLNKNLTQRDKWIKYFTYKKNYHLGILKIFLSNAILCSIISLLFLPFISNLAYIWLALSFSLTSASLYKAHVCKKFNRTINKINSNKIKNSKLLEELIKDEHKIDILIQQLQAENNKEKIQKSNLNTDNTLENLSI